MMHGKPEVFQHNFHVSVILLELMTPPMTMAAHTRSTTTHSKTPGCPILA